MLSHRIITIEKFRGPVRLTRTHSANGLSKRAEKKGRCDDETRINPNWEELVTVVPPHDRVCVIGPGSFCVRPRTHLFIDPEAG